MISKFLRKLTIKNVFNFTQGEIRMFLHRYGLLRKHIAEQFEFRSIKANPDCHSLGKCVECGCKVPDVFMADKPCDAGCYPPMMSKTHWTWWKKFNGFKHEINNPLVTKENWTSTHLDLGEVNTGGRKDFAFTYIGKYKLSAVKGACYCTTTKIVGNTIVGTYTGIKTTAPIEDTRKINVTLTTPFGELTDVLTITTKVNP